MENKIAITKELRDYIEKLHYEAMRYKDLLNTVHRNICPMSDEEWNSSLRYYRKRNAEAWFCLNTAMQEVYDMYRDEIGEKDWHINFPDCVVVVGSRESVPSVERDEPYQDMLARLYPPETPEELSINCSAAKDITFQVTDACNMACSYCYQHNKGHHSMSFEVAKKFIDMLLDADERTNTYITSTECTGAIINFIGGEPWLEIELIDQISDYFIGELFRRKHPWAIRFVFNVSSNGLLHFDPRVQSYIKKHMRRFAYNISIDGNQDLHDACRVDLNGNGTYERAIAGVKDYRETFGGVMGSKMTIAPGNVNKVFEAVSYMIENSKYNLVHLNCVYEEGWTTEHATVLYRELCKLTDWLEEKGLLDVINLSIFSENCGKPLDEKDDRNWCGGTGLMLAVDWRGDIYPCLRYMESSLSGKVPPFIIGNVDVGINRKKEHCDRIDCLSCITRKTQSTDECWNCPIATGCGWCSGYNYECFGTPNKRAIFICCMHKARSLANFYYWRKKNVEFQFHCPKEWAVEIIGEDEYKKLISME